MSDLNVQVAEAVRATINGATPGTFSEAFTASRVYTLDQALDETAQLAVNVIPATIASTPATRASDNHVVECDFAVIEKVGRDAGGDIDSTRCDQLMTVASELYEFFARRALSGMAAAKYLGRRRDPVYDEELLRTRGVFVTRITVRYQVQQ